MSTGLAATTLLERESCLDALDQSLAEAAGGHGRLVLVYGEAGVGKTALVRRFCDDQEPRHVLCGVCDPLFTPRPLGPLLDLVAGGAKGAPDAHDVVAALADELRRPGSILVLEDLHWADEATLDVLKLLSNRLDSLPALVVVTYRDDELEATHPLRHLLGQLAGSGAVRRLPLDRLSLDAVQALATPHGIEADDLYRNTGGNPFFVTEVLAAPGDEIPATVRDAVLARSARLGDDARALLDAVAIATSDAELWLLEALVPDELGALDECLASGMLVRRSSGVGFRHELARLTIEDSIAPDRALVLHRRALVGLETPAVGAPDLARLAHHAEAAGDAAAVLHYASLAARLAAEVGAHREAAAQYARALRFADGLAPEERANLLHLRADECYLTDQQEEAIAAAQAAAACYREVGDRLGEGRSILFVSSISWCPGRTQEAEEAGWAAVEILKPLGPGLELAQAYGNLASLRRDGDDLKGAIEWASRALILADELGDAATACAQRITIATAKALHGDRDAIRALQAEVELLRQLDMKDLTAWGHMCLARSSARERMFPLARETVEAGLAHVGERGYLLWKLYLLAYRARIELDQGQWTEAADTTRLILSERWISTLPRTVAHTVLGLVRARRGDPEAWPALDEALALAEGTGEPERLAPVAAARAEAAWLEGRPEAVRAETDLAFGLALERRVPRFVGELATWRLRAKIDDPVPAEVSDPHALELAGDWRAAAERWRQLGCPYEAALALAETEDEEALRAALDQLQELEARPAATMVSRRLREHGVRGVPRGPRPATRSNPAGMTTRELEVLALVAEGLRNSEIADRLALSERTVDHHVSAILRKLNVRSRAEATAEALRLGLSDLLAG